MFDERCGCGDKHSEEDLKLQIVSGAPIRAFRNEGEHLKVSLMVCRACGSVYAANTQKDPERLRKMAEVFLQACDLKMECFHIARDLANAAIRHGDARAGEFAREVLVEGSYKIDRATVLADYLLNGHKVSG
jgi:hypothetical protein